MDGWGRMKVGINIGGLRRRPGRRQSFPLLRLSVFSSWSYIPFLPSFPSSLSSPSSYCDAPALGVTLVLWDLPSCLHSPPPPSPCPPPLLAIYLPILRRSSEDGATEPSSLEEQEHSAGVSGTVAVDEEGGRERMAGRSKAAGLGWRMGDA